MADDADDNLFCFRVGKIKHPVIADADTKAVAIFQFLAAVRKWILFERENGLADADFRGAHSGVARRRPVGRRLDEISARRRLAVNFEN
jgi:hypothetical protein